MAWSLAAIVVIDDSKNKPEFNVLVSTSLWTVPQLYIECPASCELYCHGIDDSVNSSSSNNNNTGMNDVIRRLGLCAVVVYSPPALVCRLVYSTAFYMYIPHRDDAH